MSYTSEFVESIEKPGQFWERQSNKISWFQSPENILTKDEHGFSQWFKGGTLNTCYLALDKHVATGRGSQAALI